MKRVEMRSLSILGSFAERNSMINAVRFSHTPDITVVNQRQFELHYGLYKNYVNSINKLTCEIEHASEDIKEEANTTNGLFRSLKRGETYALNGVILHELYFRNMGGTTSAPKEQLKAALEERFGSVDKWREDFVATAKASRGWTILVYDERGKCLRNILLDGHDEGMVAFAHPLLVLDMYEHAYFFQYGSNRGAYIEAFMQNIHWDIVAQRMNYYGV